MERQGPMTSPEESIININTAFLNAKVIAREANELKKESCCAPGTHDVLDVLGMLYTASTSYTYSFGKPQNNSTSILISSCPVPFLLAT